ncbi:MAG: hypothetical protein ISS19_12900 [Bacteroidales bacterium]|nr:hypothetical protein [Bacteroidales bacterium]
MAPEKKLEIKSALEDFSAGNLTQNALRFFETLGYCTDRRNPLDEPTAECFKNSFLDSGMPFRVEKAMMKQWTHVDLLFQLTKSEIRKLLKENSAQAEMDFGTEGVVGINKSIIESYLFFTIGLTGTNYTRTELSNITREMNRLFPMPVMILFKHGATLTLSVINRRIHKKDPGKDVLEKVTLIKDIRIENPHRAHLDILFDLSFGEVVRKFRIRSFIELQQSWQQILDIQTLNNNFYKDLQYWFYVSLQEIRLSGPNVPDYIKKDELKKNFLVRLMARLMFCWFLKEKGLIRSELLELFSLENNRYPLTKDIEEDNFFSSNSYYRGILQNVFFNCLNVKEKKTIKDLGWTKYFHTDLALSWFFTIPYLNGGIFDKLPEDCSNESIEDDVLGIPNFLFYGNKADDPGFSGLNEIFKAYKFTIEENTPFEEDIALDPEMLGLVFENLLAELDPNLEESVKKSIRRLTGSYYTPRKVIQEMVSENLFLYLIRHISEKSGLPSNELKNKIGDLVFRNQYQPDNESLTKVIVEALDQLRVLDPACGSGAFPMGMLHRVVDILKLIDADNSRWIELKLNNVDERYREEFKKILTAHLDDYSRKLGIIRDSIYGIDIQPLAVQITKLRFFISLLADQKTGLHEETVLTPMPNLETKILCADSLKDIQPNLFSASAIDQLEISRNKFYQPEISQEERKTLADEVAGIMNEAFPLFSRQITGKEIPGQNRKLLAEWFMHATLAAPFFNMDFFFPEVSRAGGFDIVMGNPPYGGYKISDDVRTPLQLESKDPYGAFIARFLGEAKSPSPLRHGGVLAYIVSDTFMTIKSHLPLRKQMMQNYIHKMIRVHPDTFRATVNTAIIICERNVYPKGSDGVPIPTFNEKHVCQMVDMTNISIHQQYDRFVDILHQTEGFELRKQVSNSEYAIYYYPQILIKNNSNLPFFVASPKLFQLMKDQGEDLIKEVDQVNGKTVHKRNITFNTKLVEIYKLGDVGVAPHGISTGDNKKYIRVKSNRTGQYKSIEDYMICPEKEILSITEKGKTKGLDKDWTKLTDCFVPFEKGGESDSDDGWLPNYYVPTIYYINWAKGAIEDMKKNVGCAWKNEKYFFRHGLTFSISGIYAPTFRLNSGGVFEAKGSGLFCEILDNETLLGVIASKFARYIFKSFIKHSVDTSGDDIASFILLCAEIKEFHRIRELVKRIIEQQKLNQRYDYASHEQIEIDRLVYEAYGLNAEDIEEIENWYARRYPKLSAAQKENLRKLGKSDDYLVLYGLTK